jgi:IS605 OrfB family transposase
LFNATLYQIRQNYFANKTHLGYYELDKMFKAENQPDYYALNTQVSQNTMKWLDASYRAFFNAMKVFKTNPEVFNYHKPRIPKYKDKIRGRNLVVYSNQRLKKRELHNGIITPHQTNIKISTKLKPESINQVRLIPDSNCYYVEIVYTVPDIEAKPDQGRWASIDLGLNNLVAVVGTDFNPFLIKGTPLKSINHYYNAKLATLKSQLSKNQYSSNRIQKLTLKRNNKIKDYLHKSSRKLINHLASLNVSHLVVGKSKNWKQEINLGKRNNQNFVQVPFNHFVSQIQYKATLAGITVLEQEESYTSKCSYLDYESVCKHEVYAGSRIKRGLFKSANGTKINADVNGAANILRKATSLYEVQGLLVNPMLMKISIN